MQIMYINNKMINIRIGFTFTTITLSEPLSEPREPVLVECGSWLGD